MPRLTDEKAAQIAARHRAATPGLYQWDMWSKGPVHLRTVAAPGYIVMQFTRWGLNGAAPMFRDPEHCFMRRADEFSVQRFTHRQTYDLDVNHPDAQALAHSWQDVDDLLADRAELLGLLGRIAQVLSTMPQGPNGDDDLMDSRSAMQELFEQLRAIDTDLREVLTGG